MVFSIISSVFTQKCLVVFIIMRDEQTLLYLGFRLNSNIFGFPLRLSFTSLNFNRFFLSIYSSAHLLRPSFCFHAFLYHFLLLFMECFLRSHLLQEGSSFQVTSCSQNQFLYFPPQVNKWLSRLPWHRSQNSGVTFVFPLSIIPCI